MKFCWPLLVITGLAGAASAQVGFEQGYARPGGVYAAAPGATPQACATLCADDGLCMSWTFADGQCELKAVIAPAVLHEGAVSGLSPRAPNLARLTGLPAPPAALPNAPEPKDGESPPPIEQAVADSAAIETAFAQAESSDSPSAAAVESALMGGVGHEPSDRDAPMATRGAETGADTKPAAPPPTLRPRIGSRRPAG